MSSRSRASTSSSSRCGATSRRPSSSPRNPATERMPDPTAQETFERMVGDDIWPFLRERGFKRSKGTFHRAAGAHWQVVNLQKSAYSDRDAVSFTINLGVARDDLRRDESDRREGKRPPVYGCHFQERL